MWELKIGRNNSEYEESIQCISQFNAVGHAFTFLLEASAQGVPALRGVSNAKKSRNTDAAAPAGCCSHLAWLTLNSTASLPREG